MGTHAGMTSDAGSFSAVRTATVLTAASVPTVAAPAAASGSSTLAHTGSDFGALLWAVVLLLLVGSTLLVSRRLALAGTRGTR